MNSTSIYKGAGSIPGLAQWVKDRRCGELGYRSKTRLASGIGYSSDSPLKAKKSELVQPNQNNNNKHKYPPHTHTPKSNNYNRLRSPKIRESIQEGFDEEVGAGEHHLKGDLGSSHCLIWPSTQQNSEELQWRYRWIYLFLMSNWK